MSSRKNFDDRFGKPLFAPRKRESAVKRMLTRALGTAAGKIALGSVVLGLFFGPFVYNQITTPLSERDKEDIKIISDTIYEELGLKKRDK